MWKFLLIPWLFCLKPSVVVHGEHLFATSFGLATFGLSLALAAGGFAFTTRNFALLITGPMAEFATSSTWRLLFPLFNWLLWTVSELATLSHGCKLLGRHCENTGQITEVITFTFISFMVFLLTIVSCFIIIFFSFRNFSTIIRCCFTIVTIRLLNHSLENSLRLLKVVAFAIMSSMLMVRRLTRRWMSTSISFTTFTIVVTLASNRRSRSVLRELHAKSWGHRVKVHALACANQHHPLLLQGELCPVQQPWTTGFTVVGQGDVNADRHEGSFDPAISVDETSQSFHIVAVDVLILMEHMPLHIDGLLLECILQLAHHELHTIFVEDLRHVSVLQLLLRLTCQGWVKHQSSFSSCHVKPDLHSPQFHFSLISFKGSDITRLVLPNRRLWWSTASKLHTLLRSHSARPWSSAWLMFTFASSWWSTWTTTTTKSTCISSTSKTNWMGTALGLLPTKRGCFIEFIRIHWRVDCGNFTFSLLFSAIGWWVIGRRTIAIPSSLSSHILLIATWRLSFSTWGITSKRHEQPGTLISLESRGLVGAQTRRHRWGRSPSFT